MITIFSKDHKCLNFHEKLIKKIIRISLQIHLIIKDIVINLYLNKDLIRSKKLCCTNCHY